MNKDDLRLAELIERQLEGAITDAEIAELETQLLDDPRARRLYLDLKRQHALLHMAGDSLVEGELKVLRASRVKTLTRRLFPLTAALVLLIGLVGIWRWSNPKIIATLVSSEHATWESSLPTAPGSELSAGFLKLKSGVASIRFKSGAQVFLEAPAHLIIQTPMQAVMVDGTAVVNVPESAIGFVMDIPNGRAIDYGTEFSVSVDKEAQQTSLEVLSGEVAINHPRTGHSARLLEEQSAVVTAESLTPALHKQPARKLLQQLNVLRVTTSDEASIIQHNYRRGHLHPHFLMAKSGRRSSGYSRRSLIQFDLSDVELADMESARIRLNLVPTGLGSAAFLPETNIFAVYGVTDESAEWWESDDLKWKEAPDLDQCRLLGTFDVSRGVQTSSFTLGGEALTEFLKSDSDKVVSFVLVRQTLEREEQGLVHAFASSQHPEASGPALEIVMRHPVTTK
ncbi:hypothetical protein [Fuerstiella marisgermanici]|uniref:FecR protein n=1 Tax=Fuerstiella marisgermanici TaxID=1891926 RepID=A0A1P8WCN3_9PLAN|nr:hypothetical protein [Fuerstiella marisgermanici]APZ91822.1 FecR protein [Fuerstiella marisgermanici]